tara:strand:+ start:222 stop:611 length:390 start_codon:yes stop_codon:yes gene_type:complete
MSGTGCSGLSINNYLSKSEREHLNYCNGKSIHECIRPEGCVWQDDKCELNLNKSLGAAYLNGGFGFGKLCLDHEFTRLIIMFVFPPAYVFLKEQQKGFTNKRAIILSLIYTSLFYIPGLIHALQYKHSS